MKRKIVVDIECNGMTCGSCSLKLYNYNKYGRVFCECFSKYLNNTRNQMGIFRCQQCLDAEVKEKSE